MAYDWAWHDIDLYWDWVVDAVVRTGLYQRLVAGTTVTRLTAAGFNARMLGVVLKALEEKQLLTTQKGRLLWTGEAPESIRLLRADQARRWSNLTHRLLPQIADSGDPEVSLLELAHWEHTGQQLVQWLSTAIAPRPGSAWLDVGAGPGTLARQWAKSGVRIVVADLPEVVDSQRETMPKNVSFWAGDIRSDVPRGVFDGITLMRFIENFHPSELIQILKRLRLILAPEGAIYIAGYLTGMTPKTALFGVNVSLYSERGQTYSVKKLRACARQAELLINKVNIAPEGSYVLVRFSARPFGEMATKRVRPKTRLSARSVDPSQNPHTRFVLPGAQKGARRVARIGAALGRGTGDPG